MHRFILATALLLSFLPAFSQFNDTIHHHFNFTSTGVINRTTDTKSTVFSNVLGYGVKRKGFAASTGLNWIYGTQNGELTNNDFSALGNIELGRDVHKLYYWGLARYDKSFSLKITDRVQAGAGVGYDFIDSPMLRINLSYGILYEYGNLSDPTITPKTYQLARHSLRFLYHWSYKDKVILDGIHFYQPSFTDISDYIFSSTNNVAVKLKKWLAITGSFVFNKVTRTKRENLLMTYGIAIDKYF